MISLNELLWNSEKEISTNVPQNSDDEATTNIMVIHCMAMCCTMGTPCSNSGTPCWNGASGCR